MKSTIYDGKNLILTTDSYKLSHYLQYPKHTTGYFGYVESRGGEFNSTLFFGLQIWLQEHLMKKITLQEVHDAKVFAKKHGLPFNEEGWTTVVREYNGRLPIEIKAVSEEYL